MVKIKISIIDFDEIIGIIYEGVARVSGEFVILNLEIWFAVRKQFDVFTRGL